MAPRGPQALLGSVGALLLCLGLASRGEAPKQLPHCGKTRIASADNLLFISTLDGYVTALDAKLGTQKWSFDTGSPLLSSSIHRLELSNGGQWVRLVPSLSGALYRFSGDALEPLPLSADQLLSSSHKYSDDLVVAGAKTTSSFGISTQTGKLLYECTVAGCINSTSSNSFDGAKKEFSDDYIEEDHGEVLTIRSMTQTVRAFEPRSGQEKWNFSVGQHDLNLQPFEGCILDTPPLLPKDNDLIFKIIVPEGLICAVEKDAPTKVVWKHKLHAPVVNAWRADGTKLNPIDLFGVSHIPAFSNSYDKSHTFVTPAVYVGMHQRQLYVQESVRMQDLVHSASKHYLASDKNSLIMPWQPLPARINFEWNSDSTALTNLNEKDHATTALSVLYASEYVNGNGYYLYTEDDRKTLEGPTCEKDNSSVIKYEEEESSSDSADDNFEHITILVVSLWFWWKEVAMIAISTALFYNYVYNKIRGRNRPREIIHLHQEIVVVERVERVPSIPAPIQIPAPSITNQQDGSPAPFVSRYLTDFLPIKCLGRGGFGVVFEAINKIDECNYAVKRITLPNKKEQRQRVLREVRALAKLEHTNIVRYFNAWLEEPPYDWEDPYEKEFCYDDEFTETYSKAPTHLNSQVKNSIVDKNVKLDMRSCSIELACDALEFDSKQLPPKRQRSFSVNDSFSIVFEKNTKEPSSSCSIISVEDEDKMFYISDSCLDEVDSKAENEDESKKPTCEIVNESIDTNRAKKHRRNLSLDLSKIKRNAENRALCGKIYLYIQMQLCQEKSLREWLKENDSVEVRKDQFLSMFEQIVLAVEYVHLRRLIHRDLKPSNIFFSADGKIKVGDFGLVTAMADPLATEPYKNPLTGQLEDNGNDKFTQHVGTHLYMSPEQLRGEAHNFKVDIWSLGLVLMELLVPFSTEMEKIKVLKELRENRYPENFHSKHPDEYLLLQLMLSPEPAKRPSTLGIRGRPPLCQNTDPQYHFCLPPQPSFPRTSTSSISISV